MRIAATSIGSTDLCSTSESFGSNVKSHVAGKVNVWNCVRARLTESHALCGPCFTLVVLLIGLGIILRLAGIVAWVLAKRREIDDEW